ncbi:MAG: hypothetical protein IJJ19_00580 [Erysipelotrichaceae bacterium]|nr:hypothetical protein [Erysipelotrichaceae bacterium]
MLKRGLFYTIIIALITVATYVVYKDNEVTTTVVPMENIEFDTTPNFTDKTIDDYILSSEHTVYVIFYDSYDSNSIYLFNTILPQLMEKHGLEHLDNFVYCDLTDYASQSDITKNHWGFYDTPALAALSNDNGAINVLSIHYCDSTFNMTVDTVENWMINNDLLPNG